MTCPNCGHENAKETDYCANCGRRLSPATAPGSTGGTAAGVLLGIIAGIALVWLYAAIYSGFMFGAPHSGRACINPVMLFLLIGPLVFAVTAFVPALARRIYRHRLLRIIALTAAIVLAVPVVPCNGLLIFANLSGQC